MNQREGESMKSIAVLGTIVYDQVLTSRDQIHEDRCNKMNLNASVGGAMHNVAYNLATLQVETHFITKFGNDDLALKAHLDLEKRGCFLYGPVLDLNTPHFYLLQDQSRRLLFCTITDEFFYHETDLLYTDAIAHCAYGITDQDNSKLLYKLLAKTPQTRWILSGFVPEAPLLNQVEGIILNDEEMQRSVKQQDFQEAAQTLMDQGCSWIIVTHGEAGATLYVDHGAYDHPLFKPCEKPNTLGCGDAFASGVLYALAHELTIREAAEMGMKAAQLVLNTPAALSDAIISLKD